MTLCNDENRPNILLSSFNIRGFERRLTPLMCKERAPTSFIQSMYAEYVPTFTRDRLAQSKSTSGCL